MWTLIVATWFAGKLTFAPPLVFVSEADCRHGGEAMRQFLARGHVTPAAIVYECIPGTVGAPATPRPR